MEIVGKIVLTIGKTMVILAQLGETRKHYDDCMISTLQHHSYVAFTLCSRRPRQQRFRRP